MRLRLIGLVSCFRMNKPPEDTDRDQSLSFVRQILIEAADGRATEIFFRPEKHRVQTFLLVDGRYQKGVAVPTSHWQLITSILRSDLFAHGQYELDRHETICVFDWHEDRTGVIRLRITRKPAPGRRQDRLDDVFTAFEERSWDAIKSLLLSILNLALEQGFDRIVLQLDGPIVEISYFSDGVKGTSMTISSDSYDSLVRLIGENYFAFGFMSREFREKEYLIRLTELNEDEVAPKIVLHVEELE